MLYSFPKVHGWSYVDKNSLSTIGYCFAAGGYFFLNLLKGIRALFKEDKNYFVK